MHSFKFEYYVIFNGTFFLQLHKKKEFFWLIKFFFTVLSDWKNYVKHMKLDIQTLNFGICWIARWHAKDIKSENKIFVAFKVEKILKDSLDSISSYKKFVDITQQYFALLFQGNFRANNLNFQWRWRWWDRIQAIFLNIF